MRKPTLEGLNGMRGTYICVRQFESLQKREISIRPVRTDVRRTLIKKKNEGILWMSLPLEQWQVLTKFDGRCSWSIFWRMNEAISVQVLRLLFDIEHRKYREARNNTIGYRK